MWQTGIRLELIAIWITIFLVSMLGCSPYRQKERRKMETKENIKLLNVARDTNLAPMDRVKALGKLGHLKEPDVSRELKRFLNRPTPTVQYEVKGSDPAGEERIVSLYTVAALHELGDDSELHRIAQLVARAGNILQGPDEEVRNAVTVILSIGRVEPIEQIMTLCENHDKTILTNAVRTLNLLKLPQPSVNGPVDTIPQLSKTVTFEIRRFREELETIEKLSHGSIVLSKGAKKFIQANDYDRGTVKREGVRLCEVVEQNLDMLGLCYYVDDGKVVVCTYKEAGQRWRRWWASYGKNLAYNKETSYFVLRR